MVFFLIVGPLCAWRVSAKRGWLETSLIGVFSARVGFEELITSSIDYRTTGKHKTSPVRARRMSSLRDRES